MQPSYGVPGIHHTHQQQQFARENEDACSSVFPISNPQPQQMTFQPITHQLFHHQQHHFIPFQHQEQDRLQSQIGQEHQPPHLSFFPVKFKLGLDQDGINKEATDFLNGILQNPPHLPLIVPHSWHPPQDCTPIKQPFWKQPSRRNKCEDKDQEVEGNKIRCHYKHSDMQQTEESTERCKDLENKYRFFGELEAIYSLAKVGETNQTGSGSALTVENSPTIPGFSTPFIATAQGQIDGAAGAVNAGIGVDHGSENSIGGEAALRKKSQKKIKKRKMKERLSFMAGFFENLAKQVMDHQEMLHKKFLEVIDRMDKERTKREEEWRRQEAAKYNREALSRAHKQALASSREAQIVSYIEQITGQRVNLPERKTPLLPQQEIEKEPTKNLTPIKPDNHSRWPKAEVEALIQVRSSIETKFQEPGLKGPLWEEVSTIMASMGHQRSAKRCKEKWENINKYFKKAKESSKKRSQESKTCSYFSQLDQLYSITTFINSSAANTNNNTNSSSFIPHFDSKIGVQKQGYSDLLEASIAGRDIPSSGNMKIAEMGPSRFEVDDIADQESQEEEKEEREDDDGDDEDPSGGSNQENRMVR